MSLFKKTSLAIAAASILSSQAVMGEDKSVVFDISAQPLMAALKDFSEQSGLQVGYSGDIAEGVYTNGVSSANNAATALENILQGTGLGFEFVSDRMVILKALENEESDAAEQEVETNEKNTIEVDEEVVTTGTRLKGLNPAAPVIVFDREKLNRHGFTSLEDVFRTLPQSLNSTNSVSVEALQGEFADDPTSKPNSSLGATAINLRGLGSASTLVLVNGRRKATSANSRGAFFDVSSIPLSQVERIEVLTDGASAIYGSDAVSGVVNIILRKDYEGLVLNVRNEESASGANVSRANIAYTFNWDSGYLTASADISRNKSADINQFVHSGPAGPGDFTDLNGANTRWRGIAEPGTTYSAFGKFGSYVFTTGQIGGPDPDDVSILNLFSLGPKTESEALRFNGVQDLLGSHQLTFELTHTKQEDARFWEPTLSPNDWRFLGFNDTDAGLTFITADNPNNPFPGRNVAVGYSYTNEFAQLGFSEEREQENYQLGFGLNGDLPLWEGWEYQLDIGFSKEEGQAAQLIDDGSVNPAALYSGLNVFTDGSDPDIVASNVELLRTLVNRFRSNFESDSRILEGSINGNLFALSGGDAQLVMGFQYRDSSLESVQLDRPNSIPFSSESEVSAYYMELGLPLLADLPLMHELTMTVALRHEKTDQRGISSAMDQSAFPGETPIATPGVDIEELIGLMLPPETFVSGPATEVERSYSKTTPQVTLRWVPADGLSLRSTWGESFLAPRASQQFGFINTFDGGFSFDPSDLPPGKDFVYEILGPNPNLQPQTADTFTVGFDFAPTSIPDLNISATYSKTDFQNYIGAPTFGIGVEELIANQDLFPGIFIPADNNVLVYDSRLTNLAGRTSRTVDILANYSVDTDLGNWLFSLNAVRTLELSHQGASVSPVQEFHDSEYGPSDWAGNLFVSWDYANYHAAVTLNYSSSHRVLNPLSETDFFNPNPTPTRFSSAYKTVDLQLGYHYPQDDSWLGGVKVSVGAQNLLDAEFPFVDNSIGYLANRVSTRGRVFYLDLVKEFNF
ncbi:TonB-dependent receptor [Porticoccus sp. W117]|uniref:TonB-dependent receptor n=1 Tax=Porticoccus sp. W117 TaxID=3054777 RepID=UPI002593FE92|nr:TonB-dependent receptor [Porticoccus sp. W117]MDM3872019.1 TonB-dependent receptor [Porticoccus sp. W117]